MNCPVCGFDRCTELRRVYDDRYGYAGEFKLLQCPRCSHSFLQGDFSAEALRDLYTNYYPRSTLSLDDYQPYKERSVWQSWLDGEQSTAFRWVPENVRVLDIGSGFGESLGYLSARGCDVYGVEADENAKRVAEKFGYKVHIGLFDPTIYEASSFDYVTMNQVIEHVTDPLQTLRGISRVLKPGGQAILSTPNSHSLAAKLFGRRWAHWHAPYHLQFFTTRSMRKAADRAGLNFEGSTTRTPSAWLLYQWIHLVTRPSPGQQSPFWSGRERTAAQKVAIRGLLVADHLKINHLLTRLIDFMRLGDSRLFFLRKP